MHTVFSTECTPYFDWQSLGMAYTHRLVGQPGRLTRLLACDGERLGAYRAAGRVALGAPHMETHVHPNFARHPSGDVYAPYNKPGSVDHWLRHADPPVTADYVIVADADMVLRKPLLPLELGARPGRPVGAKFGYLRTNNYLCERHVEASKRHLCSQCGGFVVYHRPDLERVAPLWYHYTDVMRHDPESWHDTGDAYCDGKHPPWISEMYGYMFAAANAGVEHVTNGDFMMYPGYVPPARIDPGLLHYGLEFHVEAPGHPKWSFDKHAHTSTDMLACPGELFPEPPDEAALAGMPLSDETRGKLLVIENAKLLNAALEWHHNATCGNRGSLRADGVSAKFHVPVPQKATELYELQRRRRRCVDQNDRCAMWADRGECQQNAPFMRSQCARSCGECQAAATPAAGGGGLRGGRGGSGDGAAEPDGATTATFEFAVRLPEIAAAGDDGAGEDGAGEEPLAEDGAGEEPLAEVLQEDVGEGGDPLGGADGGAMGAREGHRARELPRGGGGHGFVVRADVRSGAPERAREAVEVRPFQRVERVHVGNVGSRDLFTGGAAVWLVAVLAFVCACFAPPGRRGAGAPRRAKLAAMQRRPAARR